MLKRIDNQSLLSLETDCVCNNCGHIYEKKVVEVIERRVVEFWFICKNCNGYQGMAGVKYVRY